MTAQYSDPVKCRGKTYGIAGKYSAGLFDPTTHGMKPIGKCSACWRGFVCIRAVESGWLLLDALVVFLTGHPFSVLRSVTLFSGLFSR